MSTERSVLMPQLGESVHEARVARWLVGVGDTVKEFEPLVEVETDKVTAEVPAPFSGTVAKLLVAEGDTVMVGAEIAMFTGSLDGAVSSHPPVSSERSPAQELGPSEELGHGEGPARTWQGIQGAPQAAEDKLEVPTESDASHLAAANLGMERTGGSIGSHAGTQLEGFISPVVRRFAERHRVLLDQIRGTGTGGRVTKNDVLRHLATRQTGQPSSRVTAGAGSPLPPTPIHADVRGPALQPGDTFIAHSRLRQQVAERMSQSKLTIPHAWQTQEVDMSGVVAARSANKGPFRQRTGVDLTYLPFVVKAAAAALRANPTVNSTYTQEGLIIHRDVNIAISVALEDGVMLPVIRTVDGKSLEGIAVEIAELTERVRAGKLRPENVGGAPLTINNSGTFGTLLSYSVIPLGQVGILTMEVVRSRPVLVGDVLAFKPMMYLCFSLDHRVMDGLVASRFLTACREWLESVTERSL